VDAFDDAAPDPRPSVILRATASPTQVGDWALVLTAAGIAHRVEERQADFALVVAVDDQVAATAALAGFDEEGPPESLPAIADHGRSAVGVLVAIALGAMFFVTGTRGASSRWFDAGAGSAEAILHGAWWRAVTALTLHADLPHLAGNAIASLIFVGAVGRWLGGGLAAAVILLSATFANLLNAVKHQTAFVSIGASTATFAALGLIAGLQVVRRLKLRTRRGYAWVPIGAGLALYAMLGVGAGADLYAHLFGLGVGIVVGLGVAAGQLSRGWRAPGPFGQALLGAATLGAVALCWALALG
jgi:membrane associated rhomboid family serine protease